MTREEALEVIKSHPFLFASFPDDVLEALGVLIKQEPTTKNDLTIDLIDRAELLKAMDTWDKFGYTETGCFVREPKGDYVPYVHYNDMVNCVKGMPPVTPQEPVIDKIRAEIDGLKKDSLISWASSEMIISTILNIIDKYKGDKERENDNT